MKNIFRNRFIVYSTFTIAGLLLGWLFFHPSSQKEKEEIRQHSKNENKSEVWTCAMHPQIRMDHPGKCPICGMELIPLSQSGSNVDLDAVHFTKESAALANVLTTKAKKTNAIKEIRLYGKVQADERLLQSQAAHIPGRIEKLLINFTGESVRRGQTLAIIYSPELVTAQQELIEASKTKESQPEIYEAAKEKLRQWMLMDHQIENIEKSGQIQNNFDIMANTSGIVTDRKVNNGDHVTAGTILYDIADLSKVWVMFDAYENDLAFLNEGDKLSFTVQALPGKTFTGKIIFIDPVIDPVTRVSKVRVEIHNQDGKLKPEMFATGTVNANLSEFKNNIIIPQSAVLWTGKRSVVYVKVSPDESVFKMREIELGPMLGNSFVIISGLSEGEEIVTQGAFNVDAAAQLEGKPSMMNPPVENEKVHKQQKKESKQTLSHIDPVFKKQFNKVFEQYIILKDGLVKSDTKQVKQAAQKLAGAFSEANTNLLHGDKQMQWMDFMDLMLKQADKIETSKEIEAQRTSFIDLSSQMYHAVKSFGLVGKTVYYQFCPMANNGKGAFWLSMKENIENPYYGEAMLNCGETKEVLKY